MRQLLHYQIVERLGQGAMGEVFRAVDEKLGREVAIKMLPPDESTRIDRTSQTRMFREARAASALNHPGIVTLHDLEIADGQSFIVMELVTGERFSDLAKRGLPWRRVLELVAGVAEALAFAHARDVLHRDIKSDNLMVTTSGQTKVLDFGLAKLREEAGVSQSNSVSPPIDLENAETAQSPTASDLTQAGQLVGTPAYLAPERYEGKPASASSEVFALGIVMYELLVGKRPFDRETATATMIAIQMDEHEPPSTSRELPARIDEIVAKAIAKDPTARYPSMTALLADVRDMLRVRARRWPWIAAALAAVLAASAITWVAISKDDPVEITIGASRRFTFDPSCEEYPRLHPDGKRVVYDGILAGDYEVQIRDLDGTGHRRLTGDPGWDYGASISPDGKLVAYVHEHPLGRTLRVVGIDDDVAPRDFGATVGYPSWTASGALLLGDASGQIIERSLDGKDIVRGRLPAGARLYHLVEVAGAGIALLWWTSSEADATALGELDRGGTLRVIEQSSVDYEGGLAPARRRRGYYATRKAATEGNQLLFRPWGGGAATVVGGGLSPGAGIDVSRDGKRLVFSTCVERQYIARLHGGKQTVVSQGKWQDTNPHVVDDKRLIVTSDRTGTMQGWLLEIGGDARAVTPPGALGAAPSPDGKQVVYVTRTGLAIDDLGGTPRALTTDASDTAPVFTRDGAHVVFERTTARGETELHVVAAAGGASRRIASGAQPAASPVDDTIVFVGAADTTGARRVMRTDLAGTTPSLVPNLELAAWQRPRFSADGKRLVVVRGYQQIVTAFVETIGPPTVEFTATTGSVSAADFARDGSIVAALGDYDGDLWIAEGTFP